MSRLRPRDLLRLATVGLRTRKLRAALSVLGISIGIASLVAVLAISETSKADLLAKIEGLGTPTLEIEGRRELHGGEYRIIPDRIEAATLLLAAAITGGSATIAGSNPEHLGRSLALLMQAGADVQIAGDRISLAMRGPPRPTDFTAQPYPGAPTDLQSQWMAWMALAPGRSLIRDQVFGERFLHVAELNRLGAQIERSGEAAIVTGVERLTGASVTASDLRASAALVLVGLAAEGETIVRRIHHLDRGYERLADKLSLLGARIERIRESSAAETQFAPHFQGRPALLFKSTPLTPWRIGL